MSTLRKNWLKTFLGLNPHAYDIKDVDTLSDNEIDEIILTIVADFKGIGSSPIMHIAINDFDDDFIEYLHELGYEEIDVNELAIVFDQWLKEEVNA